MEAARVIARRPWKEAGGQVGGRQTQEERLSDSKQAMYDFANSDEMNFYLSFVHVCKYIIDFSHLYI